MLYLVPTPIGNLGDMTSRAIDVLRDADLILAEDTRTTGRLLAHFDIDTRMSSYHAHNEHQKTDIIINYLIDGQCIALVTDAGTPAISDPGFLLVRACHEAGIKVSCLPGATALIPALAMSGIPSDRFYFAGFLPNKKGRKKRISWLALLDCTFVLYESPHRIIRCLKELVEYLESDREVAVIKEISKMYETIYRGRLSEVSDMLGSPSSTKGEFVVVVAAADQKKK